MGMFDTFYGKYTCEHCGKTVEFEEQTKDFKNCLLDFKLGDYVDLGDKNYFYNFTYECPECHAVTELSIGIRNGQYVGVFLAENARNMDPKELENIENGLQRRIEYDKMCEEKLGLEEAEGMHDELIALKVGDILKVLRTAWMILEVYYVKYPEGKRSLLCHPTIIYRAEADSVNRVIEVSINPFTRKLYYHVCKDNLEPLSSEECYKDFDINRCSIEPDSILEKLPEGGSIWNAEEDLEKIEKISSERCNSFSDNCRAIVGHDYGAAVWMRPVIIEDGEKIMSSNVHEVGMEISVDSSFFNDVLLDGFMKFFDPELDVNKKRFTRAFSDGGRFLTGFEREILEQNFFTYESIKEIIKYFEDIASSNEAGKLEIAEMIKVIELLKTMMKCFPEAKYISVMS